MAFWRGLLKKNKPEVSDAEWRAQAQPLFETARPLMKRLAEVVANGTLDEQFDTINEVIPPIAEAAEQLEKTPNPTSREAREAMKKLNASFRDVMGGAGYGMVLFRQMEGNLGQKLTTGGIGRRRAMASIAFQKGMYENLIQSGVKAMDEVEAYFIGMR